MTATNAERNSWAEAVSAGRTDLGLEEWLASDASLPTDNVVIIRSGQYPAVRVGGYWYQIQRGPGFNGAELRLLTSVVEIDRAVNDADAIIGRTARIIRGSLDA